MGEIEETDSSYEINIEIDGVSGEIDIDFTITDQDKIATELKGREIEGSLLNETIRTIQVVEDFSIANNAFIIDLEKVTNISADALKAIKCLLREEGDVPLYMKQGEKLIKLGKSEGYIIYKLLQNILIGLFGESVSLYRYSAGKFYQCDFRDVSLVRLDLGV